MVQLALSLLHLRLVHSCRGPSIWQQGGELCQPSWRARNCMSGRLSAVARRAQTPDPFIYLHTVQSSCVCISVWMLINCTYLRKLFIFLIIGMPARPTHTAVIQPLCRSACNSWHALLGAGGFCWSRDVLPAYPSWRQLVRSRQEKMV